MLKEYKFSQDVTIYEINNREWTIEPQELYNYKWEYKKGDELFAPNRTEFGKWLLKNNLIEEVKRAYNNARQR